MDDNRDPVRGLPPELAELDAELAAIRIEERASFGPELEAELRAEAARLEAEPPHSLRRIAIAASVALAFAVGAAFPARAALVALMQRLNPPPVPSAPAPVASPYPPAVAVAPDTSVPRGALLTLPPPRVEPVRTIPPRVLDREDQQRMIRRYYPPRLQRRRIGAIVNVLAWVDSTGRVGDVEVRESSGYPEIDREALAAAPRLTFRPAMCEGRPVAAWVQFDLVFAPDEDVLPMRPLDPDQLAHAGTLEVPPEWTGVSTLPAPTLQEASALLRRALADEALVARLGTPDGIIGGEPPAGVDPITWREEATAALEAAVERAPENPAPFLALARVLRKQGLHDDALEFLEEGIERAQRSGGTVSPRLHRRAALRARHHRAGAHVPTWDAFPPPRSRIATVRAHRVGRRPPETRRLSRP